MNAFATRYGSVSAAPAGWRPNRVFSAWWRKAAKPTSTQERNGSRSRCCIVALNRGSIMATKKAATKKVIAKKTAPARRIGGRKADTPRLHVRMYRQGLGDCFLLTIPTPSGKPFYMLI